MTNILVIGTGPLFAPDVTVFNGQALRTWHLVQPLVERGHNPDLVVLAVEGVVLPPSPSGNITVMNRGDFPYRAITTNDHATVLRELQAIHDAKPYDCIVAINNNAAVLACRLRTRLPIWADLNGYIMGEAQCRGRVYGSDEYLLHFWQREAVPLRRADRFSTASFKQMYATLGELGSVGRLGRHNCEHPFVTVIPEAAYEEFLRPESYPALPVYRGKLFPSDAFAVLWSGGFNTWTDASTLAAALSLAMEQVPKLRFVATGGAIPGHDERTYHEFLEAMETTGFTERCHMLGWVEARQLFPIYKECDIGINIDALNYETMFGARNRLTNMLAASMPVLTTLGTEVTDIIDEAGLGYVVPIGDVQGLADALVRAARHPAERKTMGIRAREYCQRHFTYAATTRQLVRWVEAPSRAPDNDERLLRRPDADDLVSVALNPLEEHLNAADPDHLAALRRDSADLAAIRSKFLFRLYKTFFR